MTGLDYIKGALELIGVYSPGNDVAPSSSTTMLKFLNAMLGTWSAQLGMIYEETQEAFTLTSGLATYTIGPSGDFVTTRPVDLIAAYVRGTDNIDHPLTIMSNHEYQEFRLKDPDSALSWVLAVNMNNPNITVTLYPPPDQAYSLRLTSRKALTAAALATEYAVPPGYDDAIMWGLAVRGAHAFGRSKLIGDPRNPTSIAGMATQMYRGLLIANIQPEGAGLDPMMPGGDNVLRSWKFD